MGYTALSALATGALYTAARDQQVVDNFADLHRRTTPAGASVATAQATASAAYADLATAGPAVAVVTGTTALVVVGAKFSNTGANESYMGFAVSGATTQAAADAKALMHGLGGVNVGASRVVLVTGLTPGSNTFTAKYRTGGGTATFGDRDITVIPLGAA